jgi:1-acyl-sn-glycerol-3-phosphate acyltransferase
MARTSTESNFKMPLNSAAMHRFAGLVLPLIARFHGVVRITMNPVPADRLEQLRGSRCIICPNHSGTADGDVLFWLSDLMHQNFNFLIARKLFTLDRPRQSTILQKLGCFSVERGGVDLHSMRTAVELLSQPDSKLVVFPEGELSVDGQLLPLKRGAAQIALWTAEHLGHGEPVYLVPAALKYRYLRNISQSLQRTINAIRDKLGLVHEPGSLGEQLESVCTAVVGTLEEAYGLERERMTLTARIDRLRMELLKALALALSVDLHGIESEFDALHLLENRIESLILTKDLGTSPFEKSIFNERSERIRCLFNDLRHLQHLLWLNVADDDESDQLRLAAIAGVLEREVLGKLSGKGPQEVLISLGEPINVTEYLSEYRLDRYSTLNQIGTVLTRSILDTKAPGLAWQNT